MKKRVLAFTNSFDATVNVVEKIVKDVELIRFNSDNIKPELISVDFRGNNSLIDCDVVWYRRPFEFDYVADDVETHLRNKEWKEFVWNFLLQIPENKWINFPAKNWYADRKLIQLQRAPSFGLFVPPWLISSNESDIDDFMLKNGKCLIKPIDNGYIPYKKDLFHIFSTELNESVSLDYAKNCPTLIQKIVDKKYDVRTIYVDGEVLFFKLESQNLDVRMDNMKSVKYSLIVPPVNIRNAYCNFIKSFSLRFCTSDFVVDKNDRWFFLENNPNGNWVWLEEFFPGTVVNHFFDSIKI